ncbi:MAG: cytidine deaminase [Ruminococcaceae bacterium]|nr:cytidine deaminase [Oscillospiraceae bacterium]
MDFKELIKKAINARNYAYIPYSNFAVGAALLTESGKIYDGSNIENASFTPTNCAERTAVFKAVSEGERKFKAIAVVGGKANESISEYITPCGVCRQVLAEFCDENFIIISAKNEDDYKIYTLKDLFPGSFSKESVL